MKTILFALSVLFITAFLQPGVNVSFAQNNCTCAECGYPCKTPMIHDSKCKYNNNKRKSDEKIENKSENESVNKSLVTEPVDAEYQMLNINSAIKNIYGDGAIENTQKEKLLLEQKEILVKIIPENEYQKLMYDDITAGLQNLLEGLRK